MKTGSVRPEAHPDFGKRPEYISHINGIDSTLKNTDVNLQKFSGYKQLNTLQKIQFRIKDHMELGYSLNFSTTSNIPRYDRLIEFAGENLKYSEWHYGPQQWMMHAARFNYFKANTFFDEAKFIVAYQGFKESRHDRKYQQTSLRNRTENVNVFSVNADFEKVLSQKNQLFYGLEYYYNHVSSSAFTNNIETGDIAQLSTRYPDGDSDVHHAALYTSYKRSFGEKTFFNTGLRYSFQYLNSTFNHTIFDFDKIENQNSAINGNIGLVLKPNQKWNISGMFSSGFRAPNVDDISKVFDSEPGNVIVPNPELNPEYSYNSEISISRAIGDCMLLRSTMFYSILHQAMVRGDYLVNGKDSIIYDGTLSRVQALVNTGKAMIYGFNAELKTEFSANWSAALNANYIEGKDLVANEPLRHTTPMFGKGAILFTQNKIRSEFNVSFNGKRKLADLPPSERNKSHLYSSDGSLAWYTLNLRLHYKINNYLEMNTALENILDHHYRTYSSGISAPGRNFIISLKANF